MFCVGLILYEMLLPPMKTFFERKEVFEKARVMTIQDLLIVERYFRSNCTRNSL